ncbi:MAG: hypothetical protein HYS21_11825 [Deltaproteobacteria bacterium]|nr:hypothetical protein [Deltaproteobacteria bacterium]
MSTEKKILLLAAVLMGLFAYGFYNIFTPDSGPISFARGSVRTLSADVMVGPYPTEVEIKELKAKGVTEIICLMDNNNPIEAKLIEDEQASAGKNGIVYLNFPMNFADLENPKNIERLNVALKHVADSNGKKIYVHCYLGRHRVGMFEKAFLKNKKSEKSPKEK